MADLTTDLLKTIAARVVADYKTKGVSLTDGIVTQAIELELSPEQIKRAVEVTNQIAHLSVLSDSEDKTIEFDVASYDGVISKLVEAISGVEGEALEKSASVRDDVRPPMNPVSSVMAIFSQPSSLIAGDLEKKASAADEPVRLTESQRHDAEVQLQRELMAGRTKLASMRVESEVIGYDLVKAANHFRTVIGENADRQEDFCKMASQVTKGVDSSDYNALCSLALGHVKEASRSDFVEYRDDKLIRVKSLHDLYKKASAHNKACEELEEKLVRADEYLRTNVWGGKGVEKRAFVGAAVRGLMGAGRVLKNTGSSISGSIGSIGKKTLKIGSAAMAGAEVAEIAQKATPRQDVWKSLHG